MHVLGFWLFAASFTQLSFCLATGSMLVSEALRELRELCEPPGPKPVFRCSNNYSVVGCVLSVAVHTMAFVCVRGGHGQDFSEDAVARYSVLRTYGADVHFTHDTQGLKLKRSNMNQAKPYEEDMPAKPSKVVHPCGHNNRQTRDILEKAACQRRVVETVMQNSCAKPRVFHRRKREGEKKRLRSTERLETPPPPSPKNKPPKKLRLTCMCRYVRDSVVKQKKPKKKKCSNGVYYDVGGSGTGGADAQLLFLSLESPDNDRPKLQSCASRFILALLYT
ncbi:hypothetical protein V8C37DRAFT_55526 [Trichoderma ceciliae]